MTDVGTHPELGSELARTLAQLIALSQSLTDSLDAEGPEGIEPDDIYEYLDRRQVYFESIGDIRNPSDRERELCKELLHLDATLAERLNQRTQQIRSQLTRLQKGRRGLNGYKQERPLTTFDVEG